MNHTWPAGSVAGCPAVARLDMIETAAEMICRGGLLDVFDPVKLECAGLAADAVVEGFGSVAGLVEAVRAEEKDRVTGAMAAAEHASGAPLAVIHGAIGRSGALIEHDVVVRAGVVLAASWTPAVPGPSPDPAGLWRPFLTRHLRGAIRRGELPGSLVPEQGAMFLAGLGLKVRDHMLCGPGGLEGFAAMLTWAFEVAVGAWQAELRPAS